jgi:hypothetical protein
MVCCSSTANINLYLPYREKKDWERGKSGGQFISSGGFKHSNDMRKAWPSKPTIVPR